MCFSWKLKPAYHSLSETVSICRLVATSKVQQQMHTEKGYLVSLNVINQGDFW